MSDEFISETRPGCATHWNVNSADFRRADQWRVGCWLARALRQTLLVAMILEIPFQLDTYLFRDMDDAKFGAISGFNISLTTICLFFLYLQWLPRQIVESRRFVVSKSLIAYFGITAMTILWASDKTRTLFDVFLLLQAVLIFFYLINNLNTRSDILFVLTVLMVGLAIEGLFMVATKVIASDIKVGPVVFWYLDDSARVAGSFGSPNVASGYVALLLAPGLGLLFTPVAWRLKLLTVVGMILGGLGLVATLSRGGWMAAGISLAIFCVIALWKGWLSKKVFAVLAFTFILFAAGFQQVLASRLLGDDGGSALSRWPLIEISSQMIMGNPLGVGANNWDVVAARHAETAQFRTEWFYFVHNKYLLVCAETGWLGLLAFLSFLGSIVFAGWRAIQRNDAWLAPVALGLTAAMIGQYLHMALDIFNSRIQTQLLFLAAALLVSLANLPAGETNRKENPLSPDLLPATVVR